MKQRWVLGLLLVAVAAGGLAFRAPRLALRPMHGDEAVNTQKFADLWETGKYVYDPNEFHGPALHYFTLPVMWLTQPADYAHTTEWHYRIVTVLFGVGLILLLPLVADGLGRWAALWAGLFTAVSPAFVFYSRYFIHETLLVFFTFAALAAGWRYVQGFRVQGSGFRLEEPVRMPSRGRTLAWAIAAGASIGLMHTTKETFIFPLAAMGAALAAVIAWTLLTRRAAERISRGAVEVAASAAASAGTVHDGSAHSADVSPNSKPETRNPKLPSYLSPAPLALAVVAGAVVSFLLFSAFLTHPTGPWDSVRTYFIWGERAHSTVHAHPWYWYLQLVTWMRYKLYQPWSEAVILGLGLVGMIVAFTRKGLGDASAGFVRFLAFYTLLLTAIYALVPYKTPWCLLGFWHGFILLAGVGAVALVRWARWWPVRVVIGVLLLAGAGQLAQQAYRASFDRRWVADRGNPYVYAHPQFNVYELLARIDDIARVAPDGDNLVIRIVTCKNYWPLPWYLRRLSHVGYYGQPTDAEGDDPGGAPPNPAPPIPDPADAPLIITSPQVQPLLDAKLRDKYTIQGYGFRPGVVFMVYIRQDLWDKYMATR